MGIMDKENIGHLIGHIFYIALYGVLIISTIILYNSANLVALLYVGWITLAFGVIFLLWSSQSRKKGRVLGEKSGMKETLVESGLYAIIRHPEFLGHILIIFALVFIAQHWVSLITGTVLILLLYLAMLEEEKRDIKKFGDAYKDYIKRVPKINLLAGVIRKMYFKKENEKGR